MNMFGVSTRPPLPASFQAALERILTEQVSMYSLSSP